jgi:D-alanyl-lipoteichoic acid acyltransferase DltB (MBOAT superfamily)
MNVASLEWVTGLLAASAVFFFLNSVRQRQVCLAVFSVLFLMTQSVNGPGWLLLVAFLASGYAAGTALSRYPSQMLLTCYLIVLVAAFVIVKKYSFVGSLVPSSVLQPQIVLVGLSYMLFRQIHFVVDAQQGQIGTVSPWTYLNYQLNLFGLQAGPIQRYQDFAESFGQLTPVLEDRTAVLRTYLRLFLGVIKVLGLAAVCWWAYTKVMSGYSTSHGWRTGAQFLLLFYLFPAYLYFNFSGYCDIVIAGASLLGLRMPENFTHPFLSRNLAELWTRWHRTLGLWIRDYLFTPLFKALAERWPRSSKSLAFLAYFIAFAIAGLWHGSTWNFLVFGVLNGLGVAAAKVWEGLIIQRRGRAGLKQYLQSPRIALAARVATVHYFCFTLIFWSNDVTTSVMILKRVSNALIS